MTFNNTPLNTGVLTISGATYAQVFDETNNNWESKPEYNRLYLLHAQNYMNDLLNTRGHVFLNDVYDRLGFKRTSAGQIVGWIVGEGDGFIDFKMQDHQNEHTPFIHLDFNVSGVIYDRI